MSAFSPHQVQIIFPIHPSKLTSGYVSPHAFGILSVFPACLRLPSLSNAFQQIHLILAGMRENSYLILAHSRKNSHQILFPTETCLTMTQNPPIPPTQIHQNHVLDQENYKIMHPEAPDANKRTLYYETTLTCDLLLFCCD